MEYPNTWHRSPHRGRMHKYWVSNHNDPNAVCRNDDRQQKQLLFGQLHVSKRLQHKLWKRYKDYQKINLVDMKIDPDKYWKFGIVKEWIKNPCRWWQYEFWEVMWWACKPQASTSKEKHLSYWWERKKAGNVKHVVGFCSLRVNMSLIGNLMGYDPCTQISHQE